MKKTFKAQVFSKVASVMDYNQRLANGEGYGEDKIIVEKTITLSFYDYTIFGARLLDDKDFIKNNQDKMWYDEEKKEWHVIMVTCKSAANASLVDSEGHDYAKYVAIVKK